MKTTLKGLFTFAVAACAGMCLTSCIDKDLYDPSYYEQKAKADYATNFENKYGKVAADQTWDFSTGKVTYRSTRGLNDVVISKNYTDAYEVQQSTLDWMKERLPESVDNRSQGAEIGAQFGLTAPGNDFEIIPIYQGHASEEWELWMAVGLDNPTEYKIWEKSEGFTFIPKGKTDFVELAKDGDTMTAEAVNSQRIKISGVPQGEFLYFYLKITGRGDWWDGAAHHIYQEIGTHESSLDGMMRALYCEAPAGFEGYTTMILGCEDNHQPTSETISVNQDNYPTIRERTDWDMNDIVFLVAGKPDLPTPVEIVEEEIAETKMAKRYMVEDLGSTDDFDFNDIVVDVEIYDVKKITKRNGVISGTEVVKADQQRAVVRALGGTIDFELYIGDTNTPWIKSVDSEYSVGTMVNTTNINFKQELAKFDVTGWNPELNNIRVVVNGNPSQGTQPRSIDFPKAGEVPMIIAYDTNVNWQLERESLPKSW